MSKIKKYTDILNENATNLNINKRREKLLSHIRKIIRSTLTKLEETPNGYKLYYEDYLLATIVLEDEIVVHLKNDDIIKKYSYEFNDISRLATDFILYISNEKKRLSLIYRKQEIKQMLDDLIIPDKEFKKLGQHDKSVAISFIDEGDPSEKYLSKVMDIINKYS